MSKFNFDKEAEWPGLAKVLEEMQELGIELSKIVMLDGGTKHWKGDVRPLMIDELADVLASVNWFVEHNLTNAEQCQMEIRQAVKMGKYDRWYQDGDEPPS